MAIAFPKILYDAALGAQVFVQRDYTYGINDTGPWQKFSAIGPNKLIEELANELLNAGWTFTVTRQIVVDGSGSGDTGFNGNTADFGISKIEAQAGWQFPQIYGTEVTENIWELDPQDFQQDITKADMPNSPLPHLSVPPPNAIITTAKVLKEMVDSNLQFIWNDPGSIASNGVPYPFGYVSTPALFGSSNQGPTISIAQQFLFDDGANPTNGGYLNNPTIIHLPSQDYQMAKNLYYSLKGGTTEFPQEASIIRHSIVASNQFAQQASYNNVDRIISSPSMYSIEGVPTTIFFAVPLKPAANIFLVTPGDLQYGWRKIRPAITRLNRWKWRISQNYTFGLYDTNFFGALL